MSLNNHLQIVFIGLIFYKTHVTSFIAKKCFESTLLARSYESKDILSDDMIPVHFWTKVPMLQLLQKQNY